MRVSVHGVAVVLSPSLGRGVVGGVLACFSSHLPSARSLELTCLLTRTVLAWMLAAIALRSPASSAENALLK